MLSESLKPLRKDHLWNKRIEALASKKINDEVNLENTSGFENYISNLTDFGLQTLPKSMGSTIKAEVSKYVKKFTNPFTEAYKEAMFKAAEKNVEYLFNAQHERPPPSKIQFKESPKLNIDKSTQLKPPVKEIEIQTFPGLGNYDDNDFDALVNNDNVQMLYADEVECNSDNESGKMTLEEEQRLFQKLEKLAERQKRMERDYEKAANPEGYLELIEENFDHRKIIEKIKRLTEFGMKIYETSVAKTDDTTLPPPEILTFKWKGKYFKLVTSSTWKYLNSDPKTMPQKSKKYVHRTEEAYLYLPPPMIIPPKKRWNKEELEAERFKDYCIPTKIAKISVSSSQKMHDEKTTTKELILYSFGLSSINILIIMVKYTIIFVVLLGIDLSVGQVTRNATDTESSAASAGGGAGGNETSSLNETSGGNQTCKFNSICYSHDDCGSEGGKCLGAFVGKCNCNSCLNFISCEDDSACGGLKSACNSTTSRCDCIEGYKANGFAHFTDALSKLCNTKECSGDGDECFGLPCNSGRCIC
uniref:Uncharacterized protein n=1 Tax=Panagrolaimus sp. PS1159 TaxID=55785 RepID=A0AC35GMF6_9BILA